MLNNKCVKKVLSLLVAILITVNSMPQDALAKSQEGSGYDFGKTESNENADEKEVLIDSDEAVIESYAGMDGYSVMFTDAYGNEIDDVCTGEYKYIKITKPAGTALYLQPRNPSIFFTSKPISETDYDFKFSDYSIGGVVLPYAPPYDEYLTMGSDVTEKVFPIDKAFDFSCDNVVVSRGEAYGELEYNSGSEYYINFFVNLGGESGELACIQSEKPVRFYDVTKSESEQLSYNINPLLFKMYYFNDAKHEAALSNVGNEDELYGVFGVRATGVNYNDFYLWNTEYPFISPKNFKGGEDAFATVYGSESGEYGFYKLHNANRRLNTNFNSDPLHPGNGVDALVGWNPDDFEKDLPLFLGYYENEADHEADKLTKVPAGKYRLVATTLTKSGGNNSVDVCVGNEFTVVDGITYDEEASGELTSSLSIARSIDTAVYKSNGMFSQPVNMPITANDSFVRNKAISIVIKAKQKDIPFSVNGSNLSDMTDENGYYYLGFDNHILGGSAAFSVSSIKGTDGKMLPGTSYEVTVSWNDNNITGDVAQTEFSIAQTEGTYAYTGNITYNGKPLVGATVVMNCTKKNEYTNKTDIQKFTALTDEAGKYIFNSTDIDLLNNGWNYELSVITNDGKEMVVNSQPEFSKGTSGGSFSKLDFNDVVIPVNITEITHTSGSDENALTKKIYTKDDIAKLISPVVSLEYPCEKNISGSGLINEAGTAMELIGYQIAPGSEIYVNGYKLSYNIREQQKRTLSSDSQRTASGALTTDGINETIYSEGAIIIENVPADSLYKPQVYIKNADASYSYCNLSSETSADGKTVNYSTYMTSKYGEYQVVFKKGSSYADGMSKDYMTSIDYLTEGEAYGNIVKICNTYAGGGFIKTINYQDIKFTEDKKYWGNGYSSTKGNATYSFNYKLSDCVSLEDTISIKLPMKDICLDKNEAGEYYINLTSDISGSDRIETQIAMTLLNDGLTYTSKDKLPQEFTKRLNTAEATQENYSSKRSITAVLRDNSSASSGVNNGGYIFIGTSDNALSVGMFDGISFKNQNQLKLSMGNVGDDGTVYTKIENYPYYDSNMRKRDIGNVYLVNADDLFEDTVLTLEDASYKGYSYYSYCPKLIPKKGVHIPDGYFLTFYAYMKNEKGQQQRASQTVKCIYNEGSDEYIPLTNELYKNLEVSYVDPIDNKLYKWHAFSTDTQKGVAVGHGDECPHTFTTKISNKKMIPENKYIPGVVVRLGDSNGGCKNIPLYLQDDGVTYKSEATVMTYRYVDSVQVSYDAFTLHEMKEVTAEDKYFDNAVDEAKYLNSKEVTDFMDSNFEIESVNTKDTVSSNAAKSLMNSVKNTPGIGELIDLDGGMSQYTEGKLGFKNEKLIGAALDAKGAIVTVDTSKLSEYKSMPYTLANGKKGTLYCKTLNFYEDAKGRHTYNMQEMIETLLKGTVDDASEAEISNAYNISTEISKADKFGVCYVTFFMDDKGNTYPVVIDSLNNDAGTIVKSHEIEIEEVAVGSSDSGSPSVTQGYVCEGTMSFGMDAANTGAQQVLSDVFNAEELSNGLGIVTTGKACADTMGNGFNQCKNLEDLRILLEKVNNECISRGLDEHKANTVRDKYEKKVFNLQTAISLWTAGSITVSGIATMLAATGFITGGATWIVGLTIAAASAIINAILHKCYDDTVKEMKDIINRYNGTDGYYPCLQGSHTNKYDTPLMTMNFDPSGMIYDGSLDNPVSDAKVIIYVSAIGSEADAIAWLKSSDEGYTADLEQKYESMGIFGPDYCGQRGIIITCEDGLFEWMVPDGCYWKVTASKGEAYGESEWMKVLPERFNVNINLSGAANPDKPQEDSIVKKIISLNGKKGTVTAEVTFDLAGADEPEALYEYASGNKKAKLTKNISKVGYTFTGWYYTDSKTGKDKKLTVVNEKALSANKDLKLTAKWKENKYTAQFKIVKPDKNAKVVKTKGMKVGNQKVLYESKAVTLYDSKYLSCDGYELVGWTKDAGAKVNPVGSYELVTDNIKLAGDIKKNNKVVLYSVWKKK